MHRGAGAPAVRCMVFDVVWSEVVTLLRWASASTAGAAALVTGVLWRLTRLLHLPAPVQLRALAAEVDVLGNAAIGAFTESDQERLDR